MSMERLLQTDCIKEAETLAAVGGGQNVLEILRLGG